MNFKWKKKHRYNLRSDKVFCTFGLDLASLRIIFPLSKKDYTLKKESGNQNSWGKCFHQLSSFAIQCRKVTVRKIQIHQSSSIYQCLLTIEKFIRLNCLHEPNHDNFNHIGNVCNQFYWSHKTLQMEFVISRMFSISFSAHGWNSFTNGNYF